MKDPFDAYFDIIRANGIYYTISEEDLCRIIRDPNACVGTDGNCRSMEEKIHPRTLGAFLRRYHKELGLLRLEEIIHKLTAFPAGRAGLTSKGLIADGYDADLVAFDYAALTDRADYIDSTALGCGIEQVFAAGQAVYRVGTLTGATTRAPAGPQRPWAISLLRIEKGLSQNRDPKNRDKEKAAEVRLMEGLSNFYHASEWT